MTAVIYTRKSTVSDGKSTQDQERECQNWCDTNKIRIAKTFKDEGKSASRYGKKARDAWADLKAYLRPGHILVAWEASRATRDMAEGAALINLCAELGVPMAYNGRVLDPTSGDAEMYAAVEKDRQRKIADLRPQSAPREKPLLTYATWPEGTVREKRETVRALLDISIPSIKHLRRRATEDDIDITPR